MTRLWSMYRSSWHGQLGWRGDLMVAAVFAALVCWTVAGVITIVQLLT